MSEAKIYEYQGAGIDVQWDGRLCIHIGECGNARGDLFVGGRDPWCLPDTCPKAEAREIIERCPSGALSYRDKAGESEVAAAQNTVTVCYNGPLFVKGDLSIDGAPADMPGVRFRAALCRCGRSAIKPFCDNSHLAARFEDYGSVGERGPGVQASDGPLAVRPLPDGPLLFRGNLAIYASSGRLAWRGSEIALCRCGVSKNKPFCDGSHRAAGFKSG